MLNKKALEDQVSVLSLTLPSLRPKLYLKTHVRTRLFVFCPLSFPQRKFRQADEDDSYFNDDEETEMANDNDAATAANPLPEQKLSNSPENDDVASLMVDVESLDQ